MIARIHKMSSGGIDYLLQQEDTNEPVSLLVDGSLASHWGLKDGTDVETLRELEKGYYQGQPLVRNAGSPLRNEGWLVTIVADQSIQELYRAADFEDHRKEIECQFLSKARGIVKLMEQDGVITRSGDKPQLMMVGKLEWLTRDGRPLLHFHGYLFNFGRSIEDGRFGAINMRDAYRLQHYYQSVLTKEFAHGLVEKLSLDVRNAPHGGIRIRGVNRAWTESHKQTRNKVLEDFKAKVGVARQKLIDRFNRMTRSVKKSWNLSERMKTFQEHGRKFGLYISRLPKRTFRNIQEHRSERLATYYVRRALQWESNWHTYISRKRLEGSALIEAASDERVTGQHISRVVDRMASDPKRYKVDVWKKDEKCFFVLERNSRLLNRAYSDAAAMTFRKARGHRISERHLRHLQHDADAEAVKILEQASKGAFLTLIDPKQKSTAKKLAEYYGSQKGHRVIMVGKDFRSLPRGLAGEYVTPRTFIKKTQPKKFVEVFLRVRQHPRLRGPHHTAKVMEQIRKPDWKLSKKTTVVVDPAHFSAIELQTIVKHVEQRRCKMVMVASPSMVCEIENARKIQQPSPSINMEAKL